jgi:hypothetical protein
METTYTDPPHDEPDRDLGATTVEYLGWAAMSTVAIVAIGAALQVLGLDLIDHVRSQLGI